MTGKNTLRDYIASVSNILGDLICQEHTRGIDSGCTVLIYSFLNVRRDIGISLLLTAHFVLVVNTNDVHAYLRQVTSGHM